MRIVILASRWASFRREFEEALYDEGGRGSQLVPPTIASLSKLPVSTVILGQVPEFKQSVSACIARAEFYQRDTGSCTLASTAELAKKYAPVNAYFAALQKRSPVTVVNPLPAFCDADWCHVIHQDEIFMRDENHLTVTGALHVLPYLEIPGLPSMAAEARKSAGALTDTPYWRHWSGEGAIWVDSGKSHTGERKE